MRVPPSTERGPRSSGEAPDTSIVLTMRPSFVAAEHLALKLRRRGYRARPVHSTGFRLADDLMDIERGEAVVVFAPDRLLADTLTALRRQLGF